MFYQEYKDINNSNFNSITVKDDQNKTLSNYLKANQAYYIKNNNQMFYIKGTNGDFELQDKAFVFYNPLNDAALYIKKEDNLVLYEFPNLGTKEKPVYVEIYEIPNLLDGKIVSRIQAEFSEKNVDSLSNNAIFINADMIKGYKQTNNENKKDKDGNIIEYVTNVYSFETIDDVATKIRYLGIIPCNIQDNDFIILNYYTND
jgi:hypothetical protein